jgi:integrase/recombinase XerD
VKNKLRQHWQSRNKSNRSSSPRRSRVTVQSPDDNRPHASSGALIPAFDTPRKKEAEDFTARLREACGAWITRSPSRDTRENYARDIAQFLQFIGQADRPEALAEVRPHHVAAWRDDLREQGLVNSSIARKMTALRSLFSYLKTYGYSGANPAHSDFVDTPPVPRDGKTVGLSPEECRRLLDAPDASTPVGARDRALLALLAYSACRVGELTRLRVGSYKTTGGHRVLEVHGKGGKERRVPLHPEAMERLETWLDVAGIRDDVAGPLFRAIATARGQGRDGFRGALLTRRGVQYLVKRYARTIGLDPAVTVHSFRVTALTTAREQGVDIIDLQDFAGHADPRTTLGYIRSRDRLSKSPAYVLRY